MYEYCCTEKGSILERSIFICQSYEGVIIVTKQKSVLKSHSKSIGPGVDFSNSIYKDARWPEIIRMLCAFAVVIFCSPSISFAINRVSARTVAVEVSQDPKNLQFFDTIKIDNSFEKLEIPILYGSSVLPAITVVNLIVRDEDEADYSDWLLPGGDYTELMRLMKMQVGPGRQETGSELSSIMNDVQIVIWPSGHVLWGVEKEGLPGRLRNRKGNLVEYRFGKIDFANRKKRIESYLIEGKPLRGYHRKSIVFKPPFLEGTPCCDLVIVNPSYIFKAVSQLTEEQGEDFYTKVPFVTQQPQKDVKQFAAILKAIKDSLPTDSYMVLTSEPKYEWVGDTQILEAPSTTDKK